MSCGSSSDNSKNSAAYRRDFGAGKHWLARAANKIWSIICATRRRQVLIEIEKARQHGLLTDLDVQFLASLGLTQEHGQTEQKAGKRSSE